MEHLQGTNRDDRTPVIRAPLLAAAVIMTAGIAAGRYLPLPTGFWAVLGAAGTAAALITLLRRRLHTAAIAATAVAIFGVSAVHVRLLYYHLPNEHVVTYTSEDSSLATIRGRIATTPQSYSDAAEVRFGYRRPPRTSFLLSADEIKTSDGYQPVTGLVRVTIDRADDRLRIGQVVELLGRVGRSRPPDNPGQFDWSQFARRNRTLVWMRVPAPSGVSILSEQASQPGLLAARMRAAATEHLTACGDARTGRLLNALIIGERHPALRSLNRTMVRAGIAHFLSISGLHLGVFLGFAYAVCRLAMLTPRRSAAVVLVVLTAYVMLAEPRAPLLRSAIMAGLVCAGVFAQRRNSTLNALALACILLLAIDPLQMFAPGFQLSFVIVAGLILLHKPMKMFLFGRWIRRRGLMVFRREQRLKRWMYYNAADWGMDAVSASLTAYLAAAPLVAQHFNLFSPYAPLLSLLVFPLVLAVLIPGYVSIATAVLLPNLSHAISRMAHGSAEALAWAVQQCERLPGLSFEVRPVGAGWVLLCYAVLAMVLLGRRVRRGRLVAGVAASALLIATLQTQRAAEPPPVAELHMLAVGAGQCAVLRTPSGETFLLDAGTRSGFDAAGEVLLPFLREMRLPAPEVAFISHANTDHYNALPGLLDRHGLRRAYLNDYFARQDESASAQGLMRLLAEHDTEIVRLRAGQRIRLGPRTVAQVLWPPANAEDLSVNDRSLVLKVTCDESSVLVSGDLAELGQETLADWTGSVRADALVLPHHGGWKPSLAEFVRAVDPSAVIASNSKAPRPPANADDSARTFYRDLAEKSDYHVTSRDGWIRVRFGAGGADVVTMHGR
ncbi:MAG: ComEC/Rec2 family competence protein [Phycisphaerae bacterium]